MPWDFATGSPQILRPGSIPNGSGADQQIARWQKALSDFGYPYDLVSGAKADNALAAAKIVGRQNGFVPVVIVPGHWNSGRCEPDKRTKLAREILQQKGLSAASGRQFLADRLLSARANPDEIGYRRSCIRRQLEVLIERIAALEAKSV